ncbi:MAG: hypothetical protein Q7S35_09685 [Candidatus Limnocylindrales bacterium]|nr:hypothetical protein [Candidatus Limnocylindrales bacterium]
MEHSIAAKYAARPAAQFVRPSTRVRERRLGLRPAGTFRAPGMRATVLHGPDVAPLTRLRAGWRAIQPARSHHRRSGRPGPLVVMQWARSGRSGPARRPGAASAPWSA